MSKAPPQLLRFALLGLFMQKPSSGYDLRKVFSQTPMMRFSDSPGSIYPAVRRLHVAGWVADVSTPRATGRRKRVFAITPAGRREMKRWLQKPVTRSDIIRRLDEIMLRFAFGGEILGIEFVIPFLEAFEREIAAYIVSLKEYFASVAPGMTLTGRLAMLCGIDGYNVQARWVRQSLATLRAAQSRPSRRRRSPSP